MGLKTAIKEYGLSGILRFIPCVLVGHDYNVGRVCVRCDNPKPKKVDKRSW